MKRLDWPSDAAGSHQSLLAALNGSAAAPDVVAKVRAVALLAADGRWLPAFVRIDVARDGDVPLGPQYAYTAGVSVVAETMPGADLASRLRRTFENGESFTCAG